MPAVSQAQRGYLFANFGKAWAKQHHFDNKGPLPAHAHKKRKRHTHKPSRLHELIASERNLETAGPKTPAEFALEKRITAKLGKPYVGRR